MTTDRSRSIVCLQQGARVPGLLDVLDRAGWHPIVRPLDEPWIADSCPADARVGIVVLTGDGAPIPDTLERHARRWRHLELVALVAPALLEEPRVREFVAVHCLDYQTLPIDPERLLFAVGHADGMARLAGRVRDTATAPDALAAIVGEAAGINELKRDIAKIAVVDVPVLITGESGTGKELAARAVHQCSPRRDEPFVAVNCVSLPPTLIHAELFGFEKGAFTGAYARRTGQFELAQRGTIFLDEIGELHPELQSLLLRFLEEKTVRRVGGSTDIFVDARVVAATNVDLEAAVKRGEFREDLYYRLNVLRLHMPPLRERRQDIPLLAAEFFARYAGDAHHTLRGFSDSAVAAMQACDWPGNVRELVNRIRRAIVMAEGFEITAEDLQLAGVPGHGPLRSLESARLEAERQAIVAALRETGRDVTRAAAVLEVSRATLYRLLAKHGLQLPEASVPEPDELLEG